MTTQAPDGTTERITEAARALYQAFPIIDTGEAVDGFQVTPAGQLSWNAAIECGYDQPYRQAAALAVNTLVALHVI